MNMLMNFYDDGRLVLPTNYITNEEYEKKLKEKKKVKLKEKRKIYSEKYYHKFDIWQDQSMINNIRPENDLNSYTDKEMEDILDIYSDDYQKILEMALKLKRTWWGIRILIKEKEYYLKHGRIQKLLWLPPKNDENKLVKLGLQIKKIVNKYRIKKGGN